MRYYQLVEEHIRIPWFPDLYQRSPEIMTAEKALKDECAPWLRITGGKKQNWVYRGLHQTNSDLVFSYRVRSDRRPQDTEREIHTIADDVLRKKGLIANRTNSIFVSGNLDMASGYGNKAYRVIPIGEFNYTWSPKVDDMFGRFKRAKYPKYDPDVFRKFVDQHFVWVIQHYEGLIRNYRKLEAEGNPSAAERIRECEETIATAQAQHHETSNMSQEQIIEKYPRVVDWIPSTERKLDVERMQRDMSQFYQGDDGSLLEAIHSEHEIMIHCKEAYYIDLVFANLLL